MKHTFFRLIIALNLASTFLVGQVGGSFAQDSTTLNVDVFWERMTQTRDLAERAITQTGEQRTEHIDQIVAWWSSVRQVQLTNKRVIQVNTDWLQINQGATDEELRALVARISALLLFRVKYQGTQLDSETMLATLEHIVQNERFQYRRVNSSDSSSSQGASGSETTEHIRRTPASHSSTVTIPSGFAQIALMILGVLVVIAFAYALYHTLRVQPATVDTDNDEDNIPPTSDAATERAAHAQNHQDYRAAIRYLYLASLLYLDEHSIIRFDPALTNYEHVYQLTRQSPARPLLVEIVDIFDRVWYGFAPVDEALYRHFRTLIDHLKQVTAPYETAY